MGQILIKNVASPPVLPFQVHEPNQKAKKQAKIFMDDVANGISVTLIDLGLARMDAGDGSGGEIVHWTPFDAEIFMGEGILVRRITKSLC
jgi:serine/threonine-protein kinase haspin